jgi:hypothetical protein
MLLWREVVNYALGNKLYWWDHSRPYPATDFIFRERRIKLRFLNLTKLAFISTGTKGLSV